MKLLPKSPDLVHEKLRHLYPILSVTLYCIEIKSRLELVGEFFLRFCFPSSQSIFWPSGSGDCVGRSFSILFYFPIHFFFSLSYVRIVLQQEQQQPAFGTCQTRSRFQWTERATIWYLWLTWIPSISTPLFSFISPNLSHFISHWVIVGKK